MTDRQCVVRRSVSSAEARSAECSLHDSSCLHQIGYCTVLHEFHVDRHTSRIYTECKCIRTDISSFDNVCRSADIFESAACAARDDSLLYIELTVADLI